MTVPEASVAVELERLRGTVATGFAEVKGSLAIVVERTSRTERDLQVLRESTEQQLQQVREEAERDRDELRQEINALKARQWPVQSVAALTAMAALAATIWQAVAR